MKRLIPAVVIIAISGFVYGQNTPVAGKPSFIVGSMKPNNKPHVFSGPEEFHVAMVRRKMLQSNPNPTTGSPQLHRMGDEAAVNIMKVLGEGVPLSGTNELTILDMIHTAFEFPEAIMVPFDQHPDATFFLLRWMDSSTQDQDLKERIAQTKQYVQAAADKVASASTQ